MQLSTTLDARIRSFLELARPNREDTAALDLVSAGEIHEITFSAFKEPKDSFLANFLVPVQVARQNEIKAWRFAPYVRLYLPLLAPPDSVHLRVEYSIPKWVAYYEQGRKSLRLRKSVVEAHPPPEFFNMITSEGPGERTSSLLDPKSGAVRPQTLGLDHFAWEGDIDLTDGIQVILDHDSESAIDRWYDEAAERIRADGVPTEGSGVLQVSRESISLKLSVSRRTSTDESGAVLEVELTNQTDLTEQEERTSNLWRQRVVVFPAFKVTFDPPQPYPSQEDATVLGQSGRSESREEYLRKVRDCSPRGVNCIPSIPSVPARTVVASTTAVHDSTLLTPRQGPSLADLTSPGSITSHLTELTPQERATLISSDKLPLLIGVLESVRRAFPHVERLHAFQWLAIQRQIRMLQGDTGRGTCHLVKAPTGTGKTLVFMANALLFFLWTRSRAVLAFPTRILNEDMYRRLTLLIYHAREVFPNDPRLTGGILIGTRDPLYAAVARPPIGQRMIQFDRCPRCGQRDTVFAQSRGTRIVGVCNQESCGHVIDYMFGSTEAADYLPAILIATPDKLFFEATARTGVEAVPMRLFGAPVRHCQDCGAFSPVWWRFETQCIKCDSTHLGPVQKLPILHWTFDEVHSLYGITGIYLSMFLAGLQLYLERSENPKSETFPGPGRFSYQVGTATVANESELLFELTRVRDPRRQILITPSDREFSENFEANPRRTRYRTLISMPIASSAPGATAALMVHTKLNLIDNTLLQTRLVELLGFRGVGSPYGINLTYVQRKDWGYTLAREYQFRCSIGGLPYGTIPFISGDTPNDRLVDYFTRASRGELTNFIANVVISLGLDIENLNHMLLVSLPESITEFVQTIGRTGRRAHAPGHVHVLTRPDLPRDLEFFENFHYMMCDLRGYFDARPIRRGNQYAARTMFANLLRLVLFAHSTYSDRYMLTANKAVQKLESTPWLKAQVIRDLGHIMVGSESQNFDAYTRVAYEELKVTLSSWGALGGGGNYIGAILSADQQLLLTLRESADRDVAIRPLDALASQLVHAHLQSIIAGSVETNPEDEDYDKPEGGTAG